MCCDVGATKFYSKEHLIANLHLAENARIIYTTGYFIECYESIQVLIEFKKDWLLAFNIGGVYVCETYWDQLKEIINHVDILFGNFEEFEALTLEM